MCTGKGSKDTAGQAAQGQERRGGVTFHIDCCIRGLQKEITGACGQCIIDETQFAFYNNRIQ
jgi:hypothetical protein